MDSYIPLEPMSECKSWPVASYLYSGHLPLGLYLGRGSLLLVGLLFHFLQCHSGLVASRNEHVCPCHSVTLGLVQMLSTRCAIISRGQCENDVTPLLTHWSYVFFALIYIYIYIYMCIYRYRYICVYISIPSIYNNFSQYIYVYILLLDRLPT